MTQSKYTRDLLIRFQMTDCKLVATTFLFGFNLKDDDDTHLVDCTKYRQLVGSILCLTHSRLVCCWSNFQMHCRSHMNCIRKLPSAYSDMSKVPLALVYTMQQDVPQILSATHLDWAGDGTDRKSSSGYVLSLGSSPICWSNKEQCAIALSLEKVEYRGAVNTTIQAILLQHFLTDLGVQFHQLTVIWCDNQSRLKFCRDLVQRQRTMHIEIQMHFIRALIHDGIIDLQYCPSSEQVVDIFTKTFTEQKFAPLRDLLGVDTIAQQLTQLALFIFRGGFFLLDYPSFLIFQLFYFFIDVLHMGTSHGLLPKTIFHLLRTPQLCLRGGVQVHAHLFTQYIIFSYVLQFMLRVHMVSFGPRYSPHRQGHTSS